MLLATVHNVAQERLEFARHLAGRTLRAQGYVDVFAAVVNLRDGADEILGSTSQ